MNIEVKNKNEIYEIPLCSIIQLCGENIKKRNLYVTHWKNIFHFQNIWHGKINIKIIFG